MTQRMSLQTHLTLLVGIPLLVLLMIEMLFSYWVGTRAANEVFDSWLLDSAHSIAQEVRLEDRRLRFVAAEDAIEMFEWDEVDRTYFHLQDAGGNRIAGDLPASVPVDSTVLRQGPVFQDLDIGGSPGRMVTVLRNAGRPDELIVQVAETLNKRQSMTADVLGLVLLKEILFVVGVIIAVALAVKRGLEPLRRLTRDLALRSPRDFTPVAANGAPQEVHALIANTNSLLGRIESTISAHERFIGNIAHQVRTPVAGIKLQTQLALRESDIGKLRLALERIGAAADHMTHVSSQLLKLARAEIALDRGTTTAPTDLLGIANSCCRELEGLARSRQVKVSVSAGTEDLDIVGDPTLLYEMLRNLVENAIVYGDAGGHVWVRIEERPGILRLIVEDDGPGIGEEHRGQIFDQFFRPPDSPGDGSGLGLPIAREIARAHDAQIRLESREQGRGCRFVIDLPTARSRRQSGGRQRSAA